MVKQKYRAVDIMETIKSNTTLCDNSSGLKMNLTMPLISDANELRDLDTMSSKFISSKPRKNSLNLNTNNNIGATTNGEHKSELMEPRNLSVSPSASPNSMDHISDNEDTKAPSPPHYSLSTSVSNNHLRINNNLMKSLEKHNNNLSPTSSFRSDTSFSSKKNVSFDLFKSYVDKAALQKRNTSTEILQQPIEHPLSDTNKGDQSVTTEKSAIDTTESHRRKIEFHSHKLEPIASISDAVPESQNVDNFAFLRQMQQQQNDDYESAQDKYNESRKLINDKKKKKSEMKAEKSEKFYKFRYNEDEHQIEFVVKNCSHEIRLPGFYRSILAELLGTCLLVIFVCGFGLPISDPTHENAPASINGCLGSGLFVSTIVWGIGHLSGANINPAVTLALLATGEISSVRSASYISAQLCGATLGARILKEFVPNHIKQDMQKMEQVPGDSLSRIVRSIVHKELNETQLGNNSNFDDRKIGTINETVSAIPIGVTLLNKDITQAQGVCVEILITFILLMCVFACLDKRRNDLNGSFPLTIGLAVTVGALFGV